MSTIAGVDQRGAVSFKRLFAAVVFAAAIGSVLLRYGLTLNAMGFGRGTIRFLSFFTILSNLLVAVTTGLVALAPGSAAGRFVARPAWTGAVCLAIVVTGLVYFFLLRQLEEMVGLDSLANIGLHYIVPILYPLWWLVAVPKGELRLVHILWWLVYPVAYAVISLARGPIVGWYPYPFLDASVLPISQLFVNILGVSAGFILAGLVLYAIDRLLGAARGPTTPV